jgi:Rps23 Pro-64 3,4-dihydroxylase Tpa1-like proline 4-hydroxylase
VLHPQLHAHAAQLQQQFASAAPFRHVIIDSFLDPAFCNELIAAFPQFDAGQSRNERGEPGRKAVFPDLAKLGPAYQRFDRLMRDPDFLDLISRITAIPNLLYDPDYIGGGTHENLNGQELDTHVDFNYHPTTQLHRRLNLIVFLNPEWQESWGGCLELLPDPWCSNGSTGVSVVPIANRCVIFETTEASWHGFRRIQLPADKDTSRRSLAVYFYTKDRPASAHSHGTVYYQRPLPDHLEPGHTLDAKDVLEIQTLVARRDKQIQFLYERELEFSEAIAQITQSPSFRLGRALTWPARAIRNLLR